MSTDSTVKSSMARADDSVLKDSNMDLEKVIDDMINKLQSHQVSLDEKFQPWQESKARRGCSSNSRIARVFDQFTESVDQEIEKLRIQVAGSSNDLMHLLESLKESLKKPDFVVSKIKFELLGGQAEFALRIGSSHKAIKAIKFRVKFVKIFLLLLSPFAKNGVISRNGAISRTNQLLLDVCLPPDRADETSTALEDVSQSKWEKRYGPRTVALLCYIHSLGAIRAHYARGIFKLIGLMLGFLGLKNAFSKFWGA
jgi:hypothetical protein